MDWFIYHLVGGVLTHYWYGVQCKIFGYSRNKEQEGIVASVALQARDVLDCNILISLDSKDIPFIASMNHRPKMWTIHAPNLEWPQCDCPLAKQRIIYKHIMKVFKVLHPNVSDGVVV
jgi:hypothetical protein